MDLVVHWMNVTGFRDNIPSDLAGALSQAPNPTVLAAAGLTMVGTYEFTAPHIWALEALAGFAHSTSILSRSALGDHVQAFERDSARSAPCRRAQRPLRRFGELHV